MVEEETKTDSGEAKAEADSSAGDKPEETDPIERANAAAERLEKANAERKDSIREKKEVIAKQILGGQTTASQAPEKKEPVSDEQYYKDVLAGKYNVKRE